MLRRSAFRPHRSSGYLLPLCAACGLAWLAACGGGNVQAQENPAIAYLDQGWSVDDRISFYFTSQGSQLVPYHWFIALEQAGNDRPFKADANMERLGFLSHPAVNGSNKDALPIGFVKDDRASPEFVNDAKLAKAALLGEELVHNENLSNEWLGLTCAACHTSNLQHGGKTYRIDGGPAMADFEKFLDELVQSLEATVNDDAKMTRFAKIVKNVDEIPDTERDALRGDVNLFLPKLRDLVNRGKGTTPFGYGRLDAFGAILNEICVTSLGIPGNHYPADAPASYPVLWDVSHLDWVQWNSSIGNPLARNVGEVLGVFAQSRLDGGAASLFKSTAHISNLNRLELDYVSKLQAPKWPTDFGAPDAAKVAAGKSLYGKTCIHCHQVRKDDGTFDMVPIGGGSFIKTHQIRLDAIKTDPKLAVNFLTRPADPGALRPFIDESERNKPQVSRVFLLKAAVGNVIGRYIKENVREGERPAVVAKWTNHRPPKEVSPDPLGYKSRPLNGIWASAPFLHNGSVPTLYDLLLPEDRRPKAFHVGSLEFDKENLGFISTENPRAFKFRVIDDTGTPIPGNSNKGHSGPGCTQYKPDDGPVRDFTDDERREIIEYVKTLR